MKDKEACSRQDNEENSRKNAEAHAGTLPPAGGKIRHPLAGRSPVLFHESFLFIVLTAPGWKGMETPLTAAWRFSSLPLA